MVAILLVVGAILAAIVVASGGTDLELTIDTCEIAADGSLSASGSVRNTGGDAAEVPLEVEFSDVATGDVVDTDSSTVEVSGGSAERWQAEGAAGDDVDRVSCDVTAGG